MKTATETFTLKIQVDGQWRWVKKSGKKVQLPNRKALRNYIRNNLRHGTTYEAFLNGEPFAFQAE